MSVRAWARWAGRTSAVGPDVRKLAIGDRVLVIPSHGTYAERVCAPADHCFPMPDAMPFTTAVAIGLAYQTAWFALRERGGFAPGHRVLVLGASGGVGMAAIQLARAWGASSVIAATRGVEGVIQARSAGADVLIDLAGTTIRDRLKAEIWDATGGIGVDLVIDPVGGEVTNAAMRALSWSGRLVIVGFAAGTIATLPANILLVKNITVTGLQWTDYRRRCVERVHEAQQEIFALWEQGLVAPIISRTCRWHLWRRLSVRFKREPRVARSS